ncbi:hypothetical protein BME96_12570 [Virgibacillus halodenitrificans]|uniref:Uncharacterized protein n=2 Tax=Virgibacillus halodenitrificans TaxID=1482 RepID=A0AAC9J3R2_VIRHA|nr:hypothetical protein BME96_12570 [Virgibacillus halodenitrificans]
MKNITVAAFTKGGGQESIVLPGELLIDLADNIKKNGSETVHLSSGKSFEVTGLLITGKEFHKEGRIIVSEGLEVKQ